MAVDKRASQSQTKIKSLKPQQTMQSLLYFITPRARMAQFYASTGIKNSGLIIA